MTGAQTAPRSAPPPPSRAALTASTAIGRHVTAPQRPRSRRAEPSAGEGPGRGHGRGHRRGRDRDTDGDTGEETGGGDPGQAPPPPSPGWPRSPSQSHRSRLAHPRRPIPCSVGKIPARPTRPVPSPRSRSLERSWKLSPTRIRRRNSGFPTFAPTERSPREC